MNRSLNKTVYYTEKTKWVYGGSLRVNILGPPPKIACGPSLASTFEMVHKSISYTWMFDFRHHKNVEACDTGLFYYSIPAQ